MAPDQNVMRLQVIIPSLSKRLFVLTQKCIVRLIIQVYKDISLLDWFFYGTGLTEELTRLKKMSVPVHPLTGFTHMERLKQGGLVTELTSCWCLRCPAVAGGLHSFFKIIKCPTCCASPASSDNILSTPKIHEDWIWVMILDPNPYPNPTHSFLTCDVLFSSSSFRIMSWWKQLIDRQQLLQLSDKLN